MCRWDCKCWPLKNGAFLVEGKYNYATIMNLDTKFGPTGLYNAFDTLGGLVYYFKYMSPV